MSKNSDDMRVYMNDTSRAGLINAQKGGFLFWLIFAPLSFWMYDWGISWGQVVTFSCGVFFGYWMSLGWIKAKAARMDLPSLQ